MLVSSTPARAAALGASLRKAPTSDQLDDLAAELYGTHRDIPAATTELVSNLSCHEAAIGAALAPIQLLMLGLRLIRAEYLKRIGAWSKAYQASPSLQPQPQIALEGDVVARLDLFDDWLSSEAGKHCLRELRWLIPDQRTILARVRNSYRGRLTHETLLRRVAEAGVPMRVNGRIEWELDGLSWPHARAALGSICRCARTAPVPLVSCCFTCGGVQLAGDPTTDPVQPCPWCRRVNGARCRACSCALHFRGGCTWNHGAHADYRMLPDEAIQLCPDCHWLWIKASSKIPRRPAASTPADINAHMETLVTSCVPAAGLYSPAAASPQRQRLRRFLQRWLRGNWQPLQEAVLAFHARCAPMVLDTARTTADVHAAADHLVRRGAAISEGLANARRIRAIP